MEGLLVAAALAVLGWSCPGVEEPNASRTLWHVKGAGWLVPAFDSTGVYFPGMHHELVAVEKKSGKIRWQRTMPFVDIGGLPDPSLTYGSGAVVAGGSVIVPDDALFGFDPTTGALRWTFRPVGVRMSDLSLPGSDGQTVYAGSSGGFIYAMDGTTGALRWKTLFLSDSGAVAFSPVAAGGIVFTEFTIYVKAGPGARPDSGGVVALDAVSGAVKWLFYFPRTDSTIPPRGVRRIATVGAHVVASAYDGRVYALNQQTGGLAWQVPPLDKSLFPLGALLVDPRVVGASGNRAFVGSTSMGYLVALNGATGNELWRTKVSEGGVGHFYLVVDSERVYALTSGIAAVDAATGQTVWQVVVSWLREPAVDGDNVYVAATDGFYAFRK